jgi:hypothetical protein
VLKSFILVTSKIETRIFSQNPCSCNFCHTSITFIVWVNFFASFLPIWTFFRNLSPISVQSFLGCSLRMLHQKKWKRKHCTIFNKMYSILEILEYLDASTQIIYIYVTNAKILKNYVFPRTNLCQGKWRIFWNLKKKIQNGIFKINWFFNRHVLKLCL